MNGLVVLRVLSGFLAMFAVPSFLCALWAFQNDRYEQASLFILVVTSAVVISGMLAIATHHKRAEDPHARDVVGFLIFAWLTLSLLGAIPFFTLSDGSVTLALFEAVSCATTTGTTLLPTDTVLPASLVAWRGILHVVGAILSISGVVIVVNMVGTSLPGLGASIPVRFNMTFSRKSFFKIYLSLAALTVGLCFLIAIPVRIDGASWREAFGLSVSAITTGSVFDLNSVDFRFSWLSEYALIAGLVLGSLNIVLVFNFLRKPWSLLFNGETLSLIVLIVVATGLLMISLNKAFDLRQAAGIATSIVSTSGLLIPDDAYSLIPVPVLMFFGFMGGAAISATGGMKIYRMLVLLDRASDEFTHLAQPNAVSHADLTRKGFPIRFVITVWAYLIAFAVISLILSALLALLGADYSDAVLTSLGSITNSAALFPTDWIVMAPNQSVIELLLSASMILGRLELLLLFSLLLGES